MVQSKVKVQQKILQTRHPMLHELQKKTNRNKIAATKQAETALVLATPTTVLPAARRTRASTELAARSHAPLPPDTTSQALLTQDELAISDEPCELQQQEGSCWTHVTVACFFICSLTV